MKLNCDKLDKAKDQEAMRGINLANGHWKGALKHLLEKITSGVNGKAKQNQVRVNKDSEGKRNSMCESSGWEIGICEELKAQYDPISCTEK